MRKYSVEVGLGLICLWYASGALLALTSYVSIGLGWLVIFHPKYIPDYASSLFVEFVGLAPVSYVATILYLPRVYDDLEKRQFINKVSLVRTIGWFVIFLFFFTEGLEIIAFLETAGFYRITVLYLVMMIAGIIADIFQYMDWHLQAKYVARQSNASIGRTS